MGMRATSFSGDHRHQKVSGACKKQCSGGVWGELTGGNLKRGKKVAGFLSVWGKWLLMKFHQGKK